MAAIVIGDITNLSLYLSKEKLNGVKYATEFLFNLFLVCYIFKRKREGEKNLLRYFEELFYNLLLLFFFNCL